jgi:hypothetical protein
VVDEGQSASDADDAAESMDNFTELPSRPPPPVSPLMAKFFPGVRTASRNVPSPAPASPQTPHVRVERAQPASVSATPEQMPKILSDKIRVRDRDRQRHAVRHRI